VVPTNWKTLHGGGWIMRYPPSFAIEVYSRCSVVVFGGAAPEPTEEKPCDRSTVDLIVGSIRQVP